MLVSSQPMFLAWGPELRFVYNAAYALFLGSRHPEAFGQPFRDVWSEVWEELVPYVDRTLAGSSTWMENLPLTLLREGTPVRTWWTFSYSPVFDDAGTVTGMFCACNETTPHVLEQSRMVAERERLFAMTRDLVGVATPDGHLVSVNPAWSHLLGWSDEGLPGQIFHELVHPDDRAATQAVFDRLAAGEPVSYFCVRLVTAQGEVAHVAWSAVPDTTPENRLIYAVGRDVTDDLRREEALRQAQRMEALGQLTGGIAHDFNNLLHAVQSSLDLIRLKPEDPERVTRLAAIAVSAAERGAKLTGHLLAFSRAQKLEAKPVDLISLVHGIEDVLRLTLGPLIDLAVELDGTEATVMSDHGQLELAILNLAINSRDAMVEGGSMKLAVCTLEVSNDPELDSGRYVELSVEDTGPGMSPEVRARAFEPFFTTRGLASGTGLGLSQVYGVARKSGGIARIENAPLHGARVRMLLPCAARPLALATSPHERASTSCPRHVLVVDDDPVVRSLLVEALESLGCEVTAAESGPAALSLLQSVTPDAVLLDFAMPGMNGAEVAARIRATHPTLPIIFATGYSDSEAIEASLGPSFPLLKKPFRLSQLEAAIGTRARRSQGADG
jgi:PAS domain S-box-containing protein